MSSASWPRGGRTRPVCLTRIRRRIVSDHDPTSVPPLYPAMRARCRPASIQRSTKHIQKPRAKATCAVESGSNLVAEVKCRNG